MRARDVVGRRIVAIHQTRIQPGQYRAMVTNLDWIKLDNGTILTFDVAEGDCEYFIEASARRKDGSLK